MTTQYRNLVHVPGTDTYGPKFYTTDVKPIEYKGYRIYQRIKRICWDIVRDDSNSAVCVMQCAGLNGAKRWIDRMGN